jgi:YHS domain-containing protein
MLGLLQKHCPVCGMDVDKRTAAKRFGKYFCSEKHVDQYAQMKIERETYRGGSAARLYSSSFVPTSCQLEPSKEPVYTS